ncbi:DUF3316 domain-containing protein [Vibrio sp. SCSIO 43136]|uniref:DUF3316 domain-containing protein n=1 Tax=Vibrio sp. SCSIO 43136 TaxID=2819101 RepID=UPI0020756AA8|nr:DUF3316 domain-containing protein [Vibrio sp. SCSIO 43136]USD67764.1 DUF3316 domain-containing protein [Vibrio sp. SCSIO 43136]
MKKLALTIAAIMSTSAFATTLHTSSTSELSIDGYKTQEQAYNAGFDLADNLKNQSHNQLMSNLRIISDNVEYNSIEIKDVEVQVESYAKAKGEISYRAVLEVNYDYNQRDNS